MSGLVIADAYAVPLLMAVISGILAFIGFLMRQNARTNTEIAASTATTSAAIARSNEALATVVQQLKDIERRTERIENRLFNGGNK